MNLRKMVAPKGVGWPTGLKCSREGCSVRIAPGDAVLAGRNPTQGSLAFHKGCITGLVGGEWPESRYDRIRESIIEDPTSVLL